MFTVRIVDEFFTLWEAQCESAIEVSTLVHDWLSNVDSTPIYEINIEINE